MWRVIKSVLAAFFGVQKESRRYEDFSRGRASHFIIAGILMGAGLVLLIALVASLAAR
ncbi:DUF2970 domain-containing protein [Halomonas elongata]|uniref:DUF2970 domain-containing protein n=1 Tax=Halomonas eurihalina TaxID=42566 RepID=A0A5D9DA48_HALER|nr:DUF2970 domain-containing protein [Halomonas eurihalina]MDR5858608.1 DUF2970 domain-containing protein [Halomonas eurihalina]TZG40794.1 DUF2970 domain-containing protein [Halomonas eurihalina]